MCVRRYDCERVNEHWMAGRTRLLLVVIIGCFLKREDITEGGSDESGDCICNSKSEVLLSLFIVVALVLACWWRC